MKPFIFTDLDATMLDEDTFSCWPILETIRAIDRSGIFIIPNTSKTEWETKRFLESVALKVPFAIENGAKFIWPRENECFESSTPRNFVFGTPVAEIERRWATSDLADLKNHFRLLDTLERTHQETILGLTSQDLRQCLEREYSQLFVSNAQFRTTSDLFKSLHSNGLKLSRGGRVFTLSGLHDKSGPIHYVRAFYKKLNKEPPPIIAIGDGENDEEMLRAADIPCVIPRKNGYCLTLPGSLRPIYAPDPAPFGWRYAAKKALERLTINIKT